MPITNITSSDLKPTFVAKPDMRFATTFLSNKYRDYAVRGESIMDKATGEIFTKRPEDGRVVSFFQNKKYMYEIMLNLRVLLNNNGSFTYPTENAANAFYLTTDYDLMSINDDKINNILERDTIIPNSDDTKVHQLHFNLSGQTNGFFIRLTSRDSDKIIISWMTSAYNNACKNYTGDNADFATEAEYFKTIEKWEDSDAILYYTVTAFKDGEEPKTYTCKDCIRVNEESCVYLPVVDLFNDFPEGYDYATVEIQQCVYRKIRFLVNQNEVLGDAFVEEMKKYIYPDNNILINYCTIGSFVDASEDIDLLGNEFLVAMLDVPYVRRFMMKMSKLNDTSDFIVSPTRPTEDVWPANGLWAEQMRDVTEGGVMINRNCEVDFHSLEMYLAKNQDLINLKITTEKYQDENMYLWDPSVEQYTDAEIDTKIRKLYDYIDARADQLIDASAFSETSENTRLLLLKLKTTRS